MELYNICYGLKNIYTTLNNKKCDNLDDISKIIDPFFNIECDFYDIDYNSLQSGGAVLAGAVGAEALAPVALETLGGSGEMSALASTAMSSGNIGEMASKAMSSGNIGEMASTAMSSGNIGEAAPKVSSGSGKKSARRLRSISPSNMWDKLRSFGGLDESEAPTEGPAGTDALAGSKKFLRNVAYVCIVLLLIGGMPILPWAVIIYYTFKKLKSAYIKLVQPI